MLHEAALGSKVGGALTTAIAYAARAAAMSPLDENHQALLIELYRLIGDDTAADAQFASCTEVLERELGCRPGIAVQERTSNADPTWPQRPMRRRSSP